MSGYSINELLRAFAEGTLPTSVLLAELTRIAPYDASARQALGVLREQQAARQQLVRRSPPSDEEREQKRARYGDLTLAQVKAPDPSYSNMPPGIGRSILGFLPGREAAMAASTSRATRATLARVDGAYRMPLVQAEYKRHLQIERGRAMLERLGVWMRGVNPRARHSPADTVYHARTFVVELILSKPDKWLYVWGTEGYLDFEELTQPRGTRTRQVDEREGELFGSKFQWLQLMSESTGYGQVDPQTALVALSTGLDAIRRVEQVSVAVRYDSFWFTGPYTDPQWVVYAAAGTMPHQLRPEVDVEMRYTAPDWAPRSLCWFLGRSALHKVVAAHPSVLDLIHETPHTEEGVQRVVAHIKALL